MKINREQTAARARVQALGWRRVNDSDRAETRDAQFATFRNGCSFHCGGSWVELCHIYAAFGPHDECRTIVRQLAMMTTPYDDGEDGDSIIAEMHHEELVEECLALYAMIQKARAAMNHNEVA